MCTEVSPSTKRFPKITKMWKVGGYDQGSGFKTGPCQGVLIQWGVWMKAKRLSGYTHLKGDFFGFNVVRTRKAAEKFSKEEYSGPIYRVEVKGRYRTAASDDGIPCLLVEYVRFTKASG